MKSIELLRELTLTPGVSGNEVTVSRLLGKMMPGYDVLEKDNLGSVKFTYKGTSAKPKIALMAHMDEIGFIVSSIESTGFIRIFPIGGWDPNTLLSSPVQVINSRGESYHGVIGSIPVHFQKGDKDQKPEIDAMFVDVGARSADDLEQNFGIRIGDTVVPVPSFGFQGKNRTMISKAFDDRIGISALVRSGEWLKANSHPNEIQCHASVQEEVGARGARSISERIDADICIILEGAPADDIPGIPGTPQTALGEGVHLRLFDPRMLVKRELKDFLIDLAEQNKVKYQVAVRKGGGTDGMFIHTAGLGIPTIVLGIPVRYAHSHNSMINLDDFEELVKFLKIIFIHFDQKALDTIIE